MKVKTLSRALLLSGEEMEETEIDCLSTSEQTFWCGNVAHAQVLQVCPCTSLLCRHRTFPPTPVSYLPFPLLSFFFPFFYFLYFHIPSSFHRLSTSSSSFFFFISLHLSFTPFNFFPPLPFFILHFHHLEITSWLLFIQVLGLIVSTTPPTHHLHPPNPTTSPTHPTITSHRRPQPQMFPTNPPFNHHITTHSPPNHQQTTTFSQPPLH